LVEQVFIGFGSNQGEKRLNVLKSLELLRQQPRIQVDRVSSLYKTEPVGVTDQDWFLNGALTAETDLPPEALLDLIAAIERCLGRVRTTFWGPRTIDLDILFYGRLQLHSSRLTVPHPRLHERRFVLAPLVEIAPDWIHPQFAVTLRELLARLAHAGQCVELWDRL